jgi:hypothetical protein
MINLFSFKNKNNNNFLDKTLQKYIDKKNNETFNSFTKINTNPSLLSYKNFSSDFSNLKIHKNVIKAGCICEFSELCNLHKSNYYVNNRNNNKCTMCGNDDDDNNKSYLIYIIIGGTTSIIGIVYFLYYNKFFYIINII